MTISPPSFSVLDAVQNARGFAYALEEALEHDHLTHMLRELGIDLFRAINAIPVDNVPNVVRTVEDLGNSSVNETDIGNFGRIWNIIDILDRAADGVQIGRIASGYELAMARDHAKFLARYLTVEFPRTTPSASQSRLSLPARWVLSIAGRLVPANCRARYAQEFWSELAELTADGVTGPGQLAYAVRVAERSLMLRGALLSHRRRRAAP